MKSSDLLLHVAQVNNIGMRAIEFQSAFDAEQLMHAAGTGHLLTDLAAGRTGTQGAAAAKSVFHVYLLEPGPPVSGSVASADRLALRAKAIWPARLYQRLTAFIANVDDVRPQFMTDQNAFLSQNSIFQSTLTRANGVPVDATIDALSGVRLDSVSGFKTAALPAFSDQILPFDITLAGTNEQGAATTMKIFGVEILNEGSGVSIDDAVTEMQATFVARYVEPWVAQVLIKRCRLWI